MKSVDRVTIISILLFATFLSYATALDAAERLIPMPASETEDVVKQWLVQNGFQVFRASENEQGVLLEVQKKRTPWFIRLRPHSPLATRIQVEPFSGESASEVEGLWGYLDSYVKMPDSQASGSSGTIPEAVRSLLPATVCIFAKKKKASIQLSGFCIDTKGLIVTTAHDLKMGQTVTIQFGDGSESDGRIVKIDTYRDLCLVKVPHPISNAIAIRQGRYMPGRDDILYALACPQHGMEEINSGFLYGPPRRVEGLPLWQVQMHVELGSSGSPVLDGQGRLTAVVKGRYRGTSAVGFLIPFETLLHFLEKY